MPADPAAFLTGTWRLERSVWDARLGTGRLDGTATFTPTAEGIAWHETGRLRLGGYDGPGRRDLLIARGELGWEVRFADGRPFHPLDLAGGRCAVEHPCGADRYAGEYVVEGPDAFRVRWHVSGPAKDQRLESRYVRVA